MKKILGGAGRLLKMLANLVRTIAQLKSLKMPEILNNAEVGIYLFIYAELVLKVFNHFKPLQVWSLSVGFWCFNVS